MYRPKGLTAGAACLADTSKSYWPVIAGIFAPQSTYPSQFFVPASSWRALLQMNIVIFDSGARAGERVIRQSEVDAARAGASTNIEVIDAQRRARDADTNVAVTEDAVRRPRFD